MIFLVVAIYEKGSLSPASSPIVQTDAALFWNRVPPTLQITQLQHPNSHCSSHSFPAFVRQPTCPPPKTAEHLHQHTRADVPSGSDHNKTYLRGQTTTRRTFGVRPQQDVPSGSDHNMAYLRGQTTTRRTFGVRPQQDVPSGSDHNKTYLRGQTTTRRTIGVRPQQDIPSGSDHNKTYLRSQTTTRRTFGVRPQHDIPSGSDHNMTYLRGQTTTGHTSARRVAPPACDRSLGSDRGSGWTGTDRHVHRRSARNITYCQCIHQPRSRLYDKFLFVSYPFYQFITFWVHFNINFSLVKGKTLTIHFSNENKGVSIDEIRYFCCR